MIDFKKKINIINLFLKNFIAKNNKLALRKILRFIKNGDYQKINDRIFIEFIMQTKYKKMIYKSMIEFSYQRFLDSRIPYEIFSTNNESLIIDLLNIISMDEMSFVQFNRIFKEIDNNETLKIILNAIVKSNFNIIKNPNYLDKIYYNIIYKLNMLVKSNISTAIYLIFTGLLCSKKAIREYMRTNIWNSLFAVRDRIFSQIRNHIITKIVEKEEDFDKNQEIFKDITDCDLWDICEMTENILEVSKKSLNKMELLKNIDGIMERCFQRYNVLMKSIYNVLEKISEYLFEEKQKRETFYDWANGLNEFALNLINMTVNNFKISTGDNNNFVFENLGNIEDNYYKALSLLMDSDIKNVTFDGDLLNEKNLISPLNDSLDIYLGEAINDLETTYKLTSKGDTEILSDIENNISLSEDMSGNNSSDKEKEVKENDRIISNSDNSKNNLLLLATNIINEIRDELGEDKVFENKEKVKELIKEIIDEKYNKNVKYSPIINNAIEDALKVEDFEDL